MSQIWQPDTEAEPVIVATKGAPEAIAELCHLSAEERGALTFAVNAMATGGLRLLGVARARFAGRPRPDTKGVSPSNFSVWSVWRIRCGRVCPTP
jgi:Ca2+-transporting ATPase